MTLTARASGPEQMDAVDLDPATYGVVLHDLARVNRTTLAARPTLGFLRRALRGRQSFRLLDVGFGQGDMLRNISRWTMQHGLRAELVGVDLNPRSAAVAAAATPVDMAIDYRTGDYRDVGGGFDLIVSNLVAHHMTADELDRFLRFMESEARLGWMINDLHRHRLAHAGYPLLARVMRCHPIVREDGTLSIARSFRPDDWRGILQHAGIPAEARIVRRFPFRLCVERLR